MNAALQRLEVRFETAAYIPPPFCYYHHLVLSRQDTGHCHVTFEWIYHHREEISAQELAAEGFTGDEDFSWQGTVPELLYAAMQGQFSQTRLHAEPQEWPQEVDYLVLIAETADGKSWEGVPEQAAQWAYLLEEVIQGIYELSGKEAPLMLGYIERAGQHTTALEMEISFSMRQARLKGKPTAVTDWKAIQVFLRTLFSLDFLPEQALSKRPSGEGWFVSPGDGAWYAPEKDRLLSSQEKKAIQQMRHFFHNAAGLPGPG
jgi:hypothetical protein